MAEQNQHMVVKQEQKTANMYIQKNNNTEK